MIDPLSECTDLHALDCEWIASFTTKSCRPIYFINTSDQDIIITTIDTPINQCIGISNCSNYNESACNNMVGCEWEEFDDYNPLWNNFLNGVLVPKEFYLQDVCRQIDSDQDTSCSNYSNKDDCNDDEECNWGEDSDACSVFCDYDNKDDCNEDGGCNWYESYSYVLGNNSFNGAFQSLGTYKFCLEVVEGSYSQKCGEIIVE